MKTRKAVGKIDTNTILLIGGGVVALYLLTKKPTPTVTTPTVITVPSGGGSGISAAQYASIAQSLISSLGDIFS